MEKYGIWLVLGAMVSAAYAIFSEYSGEILPGFWELSFLFLVMTGFFFFPSLVKFLLAKGTEESRKYTLLVIFLLFFTGVVGLLFISW